MERIETVLDFERPDLVMVPGDVNSTLAATLVAAKLGVPIAHVEAGLRSFDRTMPEEINRIVADEFSDYLFIHSDEARDNLRAEGIAAERIHFVGNTMIDTLGGDGGALPRPRRRRRGWDSRRANTCSSRCTVPRSWTDRCSSTCSSAVEQNRP